MTDSDQQNYKNHWENVYKTKTPEEVSWTQKTPQTSIDLVLESCADRQRNIIDIGGGDSHLADSLLEMGFENVSVLDISSNALEKAKKRLGERSGKIDWIVSDIRDFLPGKIYDVWHDRATFHFLTEEKDIKRYVEIVNRSLSDTLIIGAFSLNGQKKCSGIQISQYDEKMLSSIFSDGFELVRSFEEDHITPFDTVQNFIFCTFKKRQNI